MRRKIAVMVCAALMTAMLGACGGSTSASSGQAEAPAETAAEEAARQAEAKEKSLQHAMLALRNKFGKNAVLKGKNYSEGATAKERNRQIGGHKA